MTDQYFGCHGIAVEPEDIGRRLGWTSQRPPMTCTVVLNATLSPRGADLMWRSDWPAEGPRDAVWEEAWSDGPESWLYVSDHRPTVRVDSGSNTITVGSDPSAEVDLHAVASTGLITLAQLHGRVVMHGCAVARNGAAIMVCGRSGSGKSSLLVALAEAGWESLSDDLCVIHDSEAGPLIWPGPPWARLREADAPPRLEPAFAMPWKHAWSTSIWQAHDPARLAHIVFMEEPGGDAPGLTPISREDAVPLFSENALWVLDAPRRGQELFPQSVALLSSVPASRLRLPRVNDWAARAVELLGGTS
jgi:hypothetical protein